MTSPRTQCATLVQQIASSKWTIVAILVLAFALRLAASNRSLFGDEGGTYWDADGTLRNVPKGYSILDVAMVRPLVGRWDEPRMLRLPFIAAGLGSILFFYLAFREVAGPSAALIVSLLLSVSPFHVQYSTEIRQYAPTLFGAGLSTWFLLRWVRRRGWWNLVGYGVGTAIALYGHAFVALLIVGQGLFLAIDPERRKLLTRWLVAQLAILIAIIPAIWRAVYLYLLSQQGDVSWIPREPVAAFFAAFYHLTLGMLVRLDAAWIAVTAVAGVVSVFLFVKGLRAPGPPRALSVTCFLIPLGLAAVLSATMALYCSTTTRYLAFVQPFLALLLVSGWEQVKARWLRAALLALLVGVWGAGLYRLCFQWDALGYGNYRVAAALLRAEAEPDDAILARPTEGSPIAYYLRDIPLRDRIVL